MKTTAGDMVREKPKFRVRKATIVPRSGVPIRIMRPMFGAPASVATG